MYSRIKNSHLFPVIEQIGTRAKKWRIIKFFLSSRGDLSRKSWLVHLQSIHLSSFVVASITLRLRDLLLLGNRAWNSCPRAREAARRTRVGPRKSPRRAIMIFSDSFYLFDGLHVEVRKEGRKEGRSCPGDAMWWPTKIPAACSSLHIDEGRKDWCRRYKVKDVGRIGRGQCKNGFRTRRTTGTGIAEHLASASRMTYGPILNSRNCHLQLILIPRDSAKWPYIFLLENFPVNINTNLCSMLLLYDQMMWDWMLCTVRNVPKIPTHLGY